MLKTQVEDPFR